MSLPGYTAGMVLEQRAGKGPFNPGGGLNVPPGCICTEIIWICRMYQICFFGYCFSFPFCLPACGAFVCGEPA